jgi:peptide/nickel transport system permease protein
MQSSYFVRRIVLAFLAIWVALVLNFLLIHLMPGDPAERFYADPRVPPEAKEEIIKIFGLDKPLWQQFFLYARNVFLGRMGISFTTQRPVLEVLLERIPWTLAITFIPTLAAIACGIWLGLYAAWKRGTVFDFLLRTFGTAVNSIPSFWLAMILIMVFAYWAKIFPLMGMARPGVSLANAPWEFIKSVAYHAALPMLTLFVLSFPGYALVMRNAVISVLGENYILAAQAKGVSQTRLLWRHVLKNAVLPLISMFSLSIAGVFGGAVLVEQVFSWYGMGLLMVRASQARDFPLVQGAVLITILCTIIANFVADLVQGWVDPRIRYG